MFRDIYDDGRGYWFLEDSDFSENTGYPCFGYPAGEVILNIYEQKDLPVIPNLKVYYERFSKPHRLDTLDYEIGHMGAVEKSTFKQKYYFCVKRHIEKLDWIGK